MSNISPFPNTPPHIANLQRLGIDLRLKRTNGGDVVIIPSLYNIVKLLGSHPEYANRLVYDDFAEMVFFRTDNGTTEDIQDHHIEEIRFDFEDQLFTTFKREDIFAAAEIVAKNNRRNPIADYVKSLEWDRIPRLDRMLIDYFGVEDTLLHQAYSRRFMISIVARLFATLRNPVKVDTVLVLYGKQGRLKSTALSVIALEHVFGKQYFQDTPFDMANKDAHLVTQGKLLVELQELAKRSKDKEIEKSFISLQIAEFRPPYKRCRVRVARKCVFAATTNKNLILTDATGSRRFWPVIVGKQHEHDKTWKIDIEGLRKNIEQIWAETYAAYKAGEQWWLRDIEEDKRIEAAGDFTDQHPLHHTIAEEAKRIVSSKGYVQVSEIIQALYRNPLNSFDTKHLEKSTRQNKAIISDVLEEEGYKYNRIDGVRGWRK